MRLESKEKSTHKTSFPHGWSMNVFRAKIQKDCDIKLPQSSFCKIYGESSPAARCTFCVHNPHPCSLHFAFLRTTNTPVRAYPLQTHSGGKPIRFLSYGPQPTSNTSGLSPGIYMFSIEQQNRLVKNPNEQSGQEIRLYGRMKKTGKGEA